MLPSSFWYRFRIFRRIDKARARLLRGEQRIAALESQLAAAASRIAGIESTVASQATGLPSTSGSDVPRRLQPVDHGLDGKMRHVDDGRTRTTMASMGRAMALSCATGTTRRC